MRRWPQRMALTGVAWPVERRMIGFKVAKTTDIGHSTGLPVNPLLGRRAVLTNG
jgi:hypothetical protein